MDNPKLKIESDGTNTEVYFDGKKIESAISSVTFSHSQGASPVAYADVMFLNEDGAPKTNEENQILIACNKLL